MLLAFKIYTWFKSRKSRLVLLLRLCKRQSRGIKNDRLQKGYVEDVYSGKCGTRKFITFYNRIIRHKRIRRLFHGDVGMIHRHRWEAKNLTGHGRLMIAKSHNQELFRGSGA